MFSVIKNANIWTLRSHWGSREPVLWDGVPLFWSLLFRFCHLSCLVQSGWYLYYLYVWKKKKKKNSLEARRGEKEWAGILLRCMVPQVPRPAWWLVPCPWASLLLLGPALTELRGGPWLDGGCGCLTAGLTACFLVHILPGAWRAAAWNAACRKTVTWICLYLPEKIRNTDVIFLLFFLQQLKGIVVLEFCVTVEL